VTGRLDRIVVAVAERAGVPSTSAELVRHGSHAIFRLPGGIVARLGPAGSEAAAQREVEASRHLAAAGISVVHAIDVAQPLVEAGRPVTFWDELPPHRPASPAELGAFLHQLHRIPPEPAWHLPALDPFAKLTQRIDRAPASIVTGATRAWLTRHHDALLTAWHDRPAGRPTGVVHGDAWQANVAVPLDGGDPVLLDLEHVAIGPPEWDLTPMAVDHVDFDRLDPGDYEAFVRDYGGYDVTGWPGFRALADVQELRWTCFALDVAARNPDAALEVTHRIACLRGEVRKPWRWAAL
jgi:hypothetical protein